MLRRRPRSRQGTRVATMMMMPPIVGTPFFSTPYGSMLASRCASLALCLRIQRTKYSPNHMEIMRLRTNVRTARKEM